MDPRPRPPEAGERKWQKEAFLSFQPRKLGRKITYSLSFVFKGFPSPQRAEPE